MSFPRHGEIYPCDEGTILRPCPRSSPWMSLQLVIPGRLLSSVGPWAMGKTRKELRGIMWRRGLEYRPSLQWCSRSSPFFQCGPELRDQNSGDASRRKVSPRSRLGESLRSRLGPWSPQNRSGAKDAAKKTR
jgi:hypothetical protein